MENPKILYFVIPCYNEEEVLNITAEILKKKIENLLEKNKISKKVEFFLLTMAQKIRHGQLSKNYVIKIVFFRG